MSLTLLQMAQNLADKTDEDRPETLEGELPSQTYRRFREFINDAYTFVWLKLASKAEARETTGTITLVAGTESYAYPNGIINIQQLQYGNEAPIRIIPWTEYERYKQDTFVITETGAPYYASIFDEKVWFFPTPDGAATVNVRGIAGLTELTADNHTPALPEMSHRLIQDYAVYLEKEYQGDPSSGVLLSRCLEQLRALKGLLGGHKKEPPRMIGVAEMRRVEGLRRIIKIDAG